jgi:hypothetical protein
MKAIPAHVTLARELRQSFSHNWKEKLGALVLAFFFWNMLKQKIDVPVRQQEFIQQHSVQGAAGLE